MFILLLLILIMILKNGDFCVSVSGNPVSARLRVGVLTVSLMLIENAT